MATNQQTDFHVEYANSEIVDILCKMSYKQFEEINSKFYNKDDDLENDHYEKDHKSQFKMIKKLCETFKINNYIIKTKYNRRGRKEGRRYADGSSLQPIWSMYRNAIVSTNCIDIDMKNAHPAIHLKLCTDNNIPCPCLKKYVNERDEIIAEFTDEEELSMWVENPRTYIKTSLFISSINFDKLRSTFPKHKRKKKITYKFFLKFDKELKNIQKKYMEIFKPELKIVKKEDKGNEAGRLMSYIGQKYEDMLLEQIFQKGISPSVLMYDGFLINKSNIRDGEVDALITQCNSITEGWVEWDEKTIKTDIVPFLKEMDVSNENVISIIESTPLDIATEILDIVYNGKLVKCKGEHYFKSTDGWVSNMKELGETLLHEISELDCHIRGAESGSSFIGDSLPLCKQIVEWLLAKTPKNDNLMDDIWEQTVHKIHFQNGVYNFINDTFTEPDHNTFIKISRDFSNTKNPELRAKIYDLILNPIFSIRDNDCTSPETIERKQLREFYLYKMSRILCGHIEDKEWLVFQGARNCGKGLLSDLMKLTFGDYVGTSNAENFLLNNRNEEEAKANSFMHDFQFKRMIICNEVSCKSYGATVFDGNKIKKAHSGGDFIEMRQLYREKTNVRFQATVLFNLNDLPQCKPSDCLEKCIQVEFNSKFIKQGEKKHFSNVQYYDANDWIKTDFIKQTDVQNEWMHMIMEAYKTDATFPERLLEEQIEDREIDDIDVVLKLFDITMDFADRISYACIKDILKEKKVQFTFAKVKKMLIGKGCKEFRTGTDRFLCNICLKESMAPA
tara:strand:- start:5298 stop:7664 length:2367 start_codon:yes stop_codon:yes gene_type:complete